VKIEKTLEYKESTKGEIER